MATLTADKKVVHVDLVGDVVRAVSGSMVAFTGNVEFKPPGWEAAAGCGPRSSSGSPGSRSRSWTCTGARPGPPARRTRMDVTVVDLAGETLTVESEHILAVTGGLRLDVQFSGLRGMTRGRGWPPPG